MHPYSANKSEPMVSAGRSGLHHRGLRHGATHARWTRLSLLRPGEKKVGTEHDLRLHGVFYHHHFSVVFLGVLVGLLGLWDQWVHWGSVPLWPAKHVRPCESRESSDSRVAV